MADSMVAGLFGLTPEMYQNQQYQQDLKRGYELAQLSPGAAAQAGLQASVGQLGRGVAGLMGVEDPQMKIISARQQIIGRLDQTNPTSMLEGAKMLAQMGDQQGAFALADYARKAQSEIAQAQQRLAAAGRERQQAVPEKIQIANEIGTIETALLDIENTPDSPDRTRAKNLLNSRLSALRTLTSKEKIAADKTPTKIGVAKGSEQAVYYDPSKDEQFVLSIGTDGKQFRKPYTGGVDTKTSSVTATASSKGADEGSKTIAELSAKRVDAAKVSAGKAVEQAGLLQELLKTPQPISGSGAPARVGALRVFSTFGLTSSKDDEALGNADKFNALAGERVISFIKALGSNPTDTDREFARTIGPALEKGTKTNTDLINFLLERARKVVKDADAIETHFYDNNYSLRGYKSPFLSDLETPKSKASDLTTEQLQRIVKGQKP
jgi:hypothetical protein